MRYQIFSSISRVEKAWLSLIDTDTQVNVYRTYEYHALLYKIRKTDPIGVVKGNTRCLFVVCYDNGEAKAIAPLIYDRRPRKVYHLLGHGSSIGNSDFIYKEERYARNLLSFIKANILNGCPLELWRIDENSFLVDEMGITLQRPAYRITIHDYESYLNDLPKKERKNCSQAVNRIAKDGFDLKSDIYYSGDPNIRKVIKKVVWIYYTRLKKWQLRSWDYSWCRMIYYASKDIAFRSLFNLPSARLQLTYINGEIAYFILFFECDNKLYLPHAGLNEKYKKYSPGLLAHINLIKHYSSRKSIVYDMGSGDEPYKKHLGGKEYYLYMLTTKE